MAGPAEVAHGPIFIGLLLNVALFGIMVTQVHLYFSNYKKDRTWFKLYVLLLFLCDTVNSVFDSVYLYGALVIHFGDAGYLGKANWIFATVDPALTAIIAILVQGFFAWRIRVLTGKTWLVSIVLVFSVASFVGGIATAFKVRTSAFVNFRDFKWAVILWLLSGCCGDIMITVILVWHLVWRRHKTGFQASDDIIDRVIRVTVQTGLVTTVCAIIDLSLFLSDPSGLHLIFNFPLSKLYTNSLMSTLNSRGSWNRKGSQIRRVGTGGVESINPGIDDTFKLHEYDTACSQVFVHVESHEMRDNEIPLTRPSMAHVSITGTETTRAADSEKEVQSEFNVPQSRNDSGRDRIVDLPTAMLGVRRSRNTDNLPTFHTYQSQRGDGAV
ncbi:hypothetical protein E1B28_008283 [Marasmius oreades]|uniref:DUF6534 domain-containing protein n=1 Tax=Marasmius oreades TaxID=181124 RepID=A0A9P7RYR2_9AGAR|nr:uncharacterized protein E1B28_008283 [Marasmius oreades]KAG7091882.1 hypothetical protein E1B28_008283 [Marasmius oreades]